MFTGTLPFEKKKIRPYIALAPMEGLMDGHFRELLTQIGGIDHCVTEFIRVTNQVYPERVFHRYSHELRQGGKTRSGTPVHIQLLGSSPEFLALNAAKVAQMGAPAIDLNFGCPAKTVNRSQGGAVLLQYPELLNQISTQVRQAVPSHIPVSAKMRLGFKDKSLALENAQALAEGGIQWLTVHARTKTEGYKPPAYWSWIKQIKDAIEVPVLANGEIWTKKQAQQCQLESNTNLLMLGRGLVATPDLGRQIKEKDYTLMTWQQHLSLLETLAEALEELSDKQLTDRLKQWLHYFSMHSMPIKTVFDQVKRINDKESFFAMIKQNLSNQM